MSQIVIHAQDGFFKKKVFLFVHLFKRKDWPVDGLELVIGKLFEKETQMTLERVIEHFPPTDTTRWSDSQRGII